MFTNDVIASSGRSRTERQARRMSGMIAVLALGGIVYGSLFPFHFYDNPEAASPLPTLIATWRRASSRGDLIANVLFYMPLGYFLAQSLDRIPALLRVPMVASAGLALSICIELTQVYVPGRTTAMSDVYTNTAGAFLGAIAGTLLHRDRHWLRAGGMEWRPYVILLLLCWFGYRLYPYVPVIDLHKYWDALKPLVFAPTLPPLDFYRHAVTWLVVALLLEALFGTARSRIAILIIFLAVLLARVLIVGTILSPAEVAGGALAVLVWGALLSRLRVRAAIIAPLFAALVVIQALEPFQFSTTARPFGWIPFLSFMQGSMEVNIRSFLEKAFTYGGLVWLFVRAGCPLSIATLVGAALVFAVRLLQVYLPGRSAEVTDVIILLMFAVLMKLLSEAPAHETRQLARYRR